jgi:hypothetical protein
MKFIRSNLNLESVLFERNPLIVDTKNIIIAAIEKNMIADAFLSIEYSTTIKFHTFAFLILFSFHVMFYFIPPEKYIF